MTPDTADNCGVDLKLLKGVVAINFQGVETYPGL
jgi:hypothetical protein